jgi:ankyrin repeat protein
MGNCVPRKRSIHQAAYDGNIQGMVAAFGAGLDVNIEGKVSIPFMGTHYRVTGTALFLASYRGNIEVVEWLLKQPGIDLSLEGVVRVPFEHGSYHMHQSPLHIASYKGHFSVVKALVTAGADVNGKTNNGVTALMLTSSMDVVQYLVENGADVNARDNIGNTVLDFKPYNQRFLSPGSHSVIPTVTTTLLRYGALPGADCMLPPLHAGLFRPARAPFVLFPEQMTPEVLSQTDMFYRTALHYAALIGNRAAYHTLRTAMLGVGVDPDVKDAGSKTASDYDVRMYFLLYYYF